MSILEKLASKAFPIGDFENIKTNAPNQMSYNIDATRDLVKNQPFNPYAPALAATVSLPYDIIQGIGRAFKCFKPDTGILDYDVVPNAPTFKDIGKSIAAENPIDSLIGRTYGATLGLGDKITSYAKGFKDLFDSSAIASEPPSVKSNQEFNIDNVKSAINAAKNREILNRQGLLSLDDAGLITEPYETFAEKAKPGLNIDFAKQIGLSGFGLLTGNPFIALIARGLGSLGPQFTGVKGGQNLYSDTTFNTFAKSTSLADFLQRRRDKKAREEAARRGELKSLQERIDKGDFGGPKNGGSGFQGEGGYGSSSERGAALHG